LVNSHDSGVRSELAGNPNIDTEIAIILSSDRYVEVRARLAENIIINREIIERLRDNRSHIVRESLAKNIFASEEDLVYLALNNLENHSLSDVFDLFCAISANPKAGGTVHEVLATHNLPDAKIAVAYSPNLSERLMDQLADELIEGVKDESRLSRGLMMALASNPSTPLRILKIILSYDTHPSILGRMAVHPHIDSEIIEVIIASDYNQRIKLNLLDNPAAVDYYERINNMFRSNNTY
jgi:hypothetical protein